MILFLNTETETNAGYLELKWQEEAHGGMGGVCVGGGGGAR